MKKALTIAGSDPSGGAGIQADLKTFGALGVYGMAVVTSLTAQNTTGVQERLDIPSDFVARQIDSVAADLGFDAVKTGMLADRDIVRVVAQRAKQFRIKRLVVDPVMASTSGASLLDPRGREALTDALLPVTFLLTPNIPEAEVLAKIRVRGMKDMERAAATIWKMGPKNVLVTGGHLKENATDVLFDGKESIRFPSEWRETRNTHGTGCALSAAITAELANGHPLKEAIRRAKIYLDSALRHSLSLGRGIGPLHHFANLYRKMEEGRLLNDLDAALKILQREKIGFLIPEVQSNFVVALRDAISPEEVAAFPGRIVRDEDSIAAIHPPAFGASRHVANIALTNMRFDPAKRACMNLRYSEEIIRGCRRLKFSVSSFDRAREPRKIRDREGSSLEWGVKAAVEKSGGRVPDIIYDRGGWGKEPVIRISSSDPIKLARMVVRMKREVMKGR